MGGVADLGGVAGGVADLFGDSDLSRLMAGMALAGFSLSLCRRAILCKN
jgi:hypothetical protein